MNNYKYATALNYYVKSFTMQLIGFIFRCIRVYGHGIPLGWRAHYYRRSTTQGGCSHMDRAPFDIGASGRETWLNL